MQLKPLNAVSFVIAVIELFGAAVVARVGWEYGFVLFRWLY